MAACFVGCVEQVIANSFALRLFGAFSSSSQLFLPRITLFIIFHFLIRIGIDRIFPLFIHCREQGLHCAGHGFSVPGLLLLQSFCCCLIIPVCAEHSFLLIRDMRASQNFCFYADAMSLYSGGTEIFAADMKHG